MLPLIIANILTGILQCSPLQLPTIWLSFTDILILILIPIFIIVAIIIILLINRIKAKPMPVLGPPPVTAPPGAAGPNPPAAPPPHLPSNACPFCQKPLPPGKIICPYCNNKIR